MSLLRTVILRHSYLNVTKRIVHQKGCGEIDKKFTTIYKFPQIGICAVVNKCKIPYFLGVGASIPASYAGYAAQLCESEVPLSVAAIGLASTAALFIIGQAFTRLVGFVYISEGKELVKISYLDTWGRRQDEIHNTKNIIAISDTSWPFSLVYKHIRISSSKPYKISIAYGDPVKISLFNEVFNYDYDDI